MKWLKRILGFMFPRDRNVDNEGYSHPSEWGKAIAANDPKKYVVISDGHHQGVELELPQLEKHYVEIEDYKSAALVRDEIKSREK